MAQREMWRPPGWWSGLTVLVWLAGASAGLAQEPATREAADQARREEKSKTVEPYRPGGFERAMHFAEEQGPTRSARICSADASACARIRSSSSAARSNT